ncbi:hypothetical protein BDF20DRAFT_832525 [Mycotypha africana]|uniref:uncharacterized protein n=1 Tax=Mycotypha africana TaxID=64632 RepID=UPI002300DFD6|nr:uncharacterized protein BDF20DRAFT_832525 [Mycotypha africana]KAI8987612.1 hypothetical protein BDF20DRAFT_832525 [Mycotypha africana]
MSNPIADSQEYFAERARQQKLDPNPGITTQKGDYDASSSSNGRKSPGSVKYSRRPFSQQHQQHNPTDFDPKQQWKKVLNRLPSVHGHHRHNRHSRVRSSSEDEDSDAYESATDDTSQFDNDSRLHDFRRRLRQKLVNAGSKTSGESYEMTTQPYGMENEDDILPDTSDLHQQTTRTTQQDDIGEPTDQQQEEPSYFTKPFETSSPNLNETISTAESSGPATPTLEPATVAATNVEERGDKSKSKLLKKKLNELRKRRESEVHLHDTTAPSTDVVNEEDQAVLPASNIENRPQPPTRGSSLRAAKKHWGKTLDKVRLIANLHTLPHQIEQPTVSSSALIPFYPPLFDPIFIAFGEDQHEKPWLAVTDSELLTQGINQWVFRIELQYGDIKWVIKRTIADFVSLHYTLKFKSRLRDTVPSPPNFPNQLQAWLTSAKGSILQQNHADVTTTAAHAGEKRDSDLEREKYEVALRRRKALTKYLRQLLLRSHMMPNYDLCEFLEISAVSIVEDMGWKGKEGFLENKVNFVVPRLCHVLKPHFWNTQWVLLRDSYIAFISDIASTTVNDVFLFDKSLVVQNKKPGLLGKYHNHITLANRFRRIEIKGGRREVEEWMESIQRVLNNSPWLKNHRFGSFAPVRHNSKIRWFIDGEDHFNAIGEAILSAKSEIYICDWWLSPELYLRRPPEKNQEFRLDRLLQRKAEEGVKVYIIIYKEMSVALSINSAHTKSWLQSLHKNIVVVRHPDHRSIDNNVLFWSHHEKIVVVDNRLAFLGGLDLCWGRYDSQKHRLTDYPAEGHTDEVFPGQDYSNPRVKDFISVAQYDLTLIDRNVTPRLPWHDMNVGMVGPVARDVARHFIQRWNFLKASKGMHRPSVPFLMPKGEYVAARDESAFKGTCRVQILRSSAQWSSGIEREHSIYNAYMECITKAKHFIYIENQFFISATGQDRLLRNKLAQAIVERIKKAHEKGENFKVIVLMPLIPAFEGDLASKDAAAARNVMHFQYMTICRGGRSIIEKLQEAGIKASDYIHWYSLRNWDKLIPRKKSMTSGSDKPTTVPRTTSRASSSMIAGVAAAAAAGGIGEGGASATTKLNPTQWINQHNDNSPDSNNSGCNTNSSTKLHDSSLNDTHSAASQPSVKAPSEKSIGDDDDKEYYVCDLVYIHDKIMIVDDRIVIVGSANINDRSMLGNRDSEIAMIIEDTDMVPSYMNGKEFKAAKFALSLRMQLFKEHLGLLDFDNWEDLIEDKARLKPNIDVDKPIETHHTNEKVTEEEIRAVESLGPNKVLEHQRRSGTHYPIHVNKSKNDHEDDFGNVNNGAEGHVQLMAAKALDPLDSHFFNTIWDGTAKSNTLIYRELFRCVPDDTVHTFEQHRKFLPDPTIVPHGHIADTELHGRDIRQKLFKIRGHLVQFPLEYLKNENMLGSVFRETVTPMVIFT